MREITFDEIEIVNGSGWAEGYYSLKEMADYAKFGAAAGGALGFILGGAPTAGVLAAAFGSAGFFWTASSNTVMASMIALSWASCLFQQETNSRCECTSGSSSRMLF